MKQSFQDGVQFAWDATSLDLAQTCPRKYYYAMLRGIKPKGTSVHLLFGGIYAKALEKFYKYCARGDSIEDAQRRVVHEALIASWSHTLDSEGNPVVGSGGPMEFNDTKKTRVNLIRTIVWYIEQFAVESPDGLVTYHLQNGEPAVELSFALEISNDIVYCGHLDRVVQMGEQLFVMDQKTTGGTVGTYYFSTFSPNNQMSGYAFAGRAVLHSPIQGVIIDAAQIAINFTRFERGITTRTKDQLDEWLDGTLSTIAHMQELTRQERFPMNATACGNYGGCQYRELCSRSPAVRENFIKSDYQSHDWDPIKRR